MGKYLCKIQTGKIEFPVWSAQLITDDSGAVTWFMGYVRKKNLIADDACGEVNGITYECFEALAEKILNEICLEAQALYDKRLGLLVVHRTGYLNVGECSILIGVSSIHRAPAYEASRYILEQIKKRAPIWKLEHYDSGESKWLKGQSLLQDELV